MNKENASKLYNWWDSGGKVTKVTLLEGLDYKALETQEKLYRSEIEEIKKIFSITKYKEKQEEFKKIKNEILKTNNNLIIELERNLEEQNFKIKKSYYYKKGGIFRSEEWAIFHQFYCVDESKTDKFVSILKYSVTDLELIAVLSSFFKNIIHKVNALGFEKGLYKEKIYSDNLWSKLNKIETTTVFDLGQILKHANIYGFENKGKSNLDQNYISFLLSEGYVALTPQEINEKFSYHSNITTKTPTEYIEEAENPEKYNETEFLRKLNKIFNDQTTLAFSIVTEPIDINSMEKYSNEFIDFNERMLRKIELVKRSLLKKQHKSENLAYLYVMSNKSYPNIYKIGWTFDLPEERAEQLSSTGVLHPFKVEYYKKFKNAELLEKKCHKKFKKQRVKGNKEFFEVTLNEIKEYIESLDENI